MRKTLARNVLVSGGAYYASLWVIPPVTMAFAPITNGVPFLDGFETAVLMPLVLGIPSALVAAGAGALTAWLVESVHAWRWAVLPAVLYAVFTFNGNHWLVPPKIDQRVGQAIQALLPAVACVLAAIFVQRRQPPPSR
jgi:hypothetical protein